MPNRKVEAYVEPDEVEQKPVRLRLIQDGDGVLLCLVDSSGERLPGGYLMKFEDRGDGVFGQTFSCVAPAHPVMLARKDDSSKKNDGRMLVDNK